MISYAGVSLDALAPALVAHVQRYVRMDWIAEFRRRDYPGPGLARLGSAGIIPDEPVRLGVLSWPCNASRWTTGYYIATDNQLRAIRQVIYADTGVQQTITAGWDPPQSAPGDGDVTLPFTYRPADLVLDDGTRSITASLFMLPARPLAQILQANPPATPVSNGAWLLTLVDDRFFWWFQSAVLSIDPGSSTWEDLYGQIAGVLDIDLDVDPVSSAYLKPPIDLASTSKAVPLIFDAVARSCGQKVVRDRITGRVKAQNVETALALQDQNQQFVTNPVIAGGQMALDQA